MGAKVQFSVECERVVSPYIHRPPGLLAGRTDATRCRERFTSLLFSVECERVVSPYITGRGYCRLGGPMQLGVERDSHLYL
ncbi:hypothetical protein J6590_102848 [Homalodisca vitripennis]|nr:hypothetical protein J6590_102848 [Homalodisca vitripennis]